MEGTDMAKTYEYTVQSKPGEIFRKLMELRREHPEVPAQGDERSGSMSRWKGFAGHYAIEETPQGSHVVITITDKPALVPWSLIESQLNRIARDF